MGLAMPEKTSRYIAKCKPCNTAMSTEASSDPNRIEYRWNLERKGLPLGVYEHVEVGSLEPDERTGAVSLRCFSCGKTRQANRVLGRLNRDIKCTAKCLAATGQDCECSCAGKNHGAKFSVDSLATRNPRRPDKPLHVVIAEQYKWFAVIGWLGNAKAGYVDCHPVQPRDEQYRGHAIRELLGGLPGWYISNAFLAGEKFRHKGYGTQLYCTAFAEAARQSGGPVVIGSAEAMTLSPGFRVGTSKEARAVWQRLRDEGKYPFHPDLDALVFAPEDVEPWMLPAKRFDEYHRGKLR